MDRLFLVFGLLPFLASAALTGLIVWLGPRDHPDSYRKAHARPIPTSGGMAIFTVLLLGVGTLCAYLVLQEQDARTGLTSIADALDRWQLWAHLILVGGAFAIGLVDDIIRGGLGAITKLVLLGALSLGVAIFGGPVAEIHIPWARVMLHPVASVLLTALAAFVFLNAVNFMDGSNGLSIGSLVPAFAVYAVLFFIFGLGGFRSGSEMAAIMVTICAMSAFAILGFLVWNVAGRVFAGDAGALGLAALFVSISLFLITFVNEWGGAPLPIWLALTLALPWLVDVLMTLVWRAGKKRSLMEGHNEHAYQLFVRAGWRHVHVALIWWSYSLICSVAAFFALWAGSGASFWCFWSLLAVSIALWIWQRRTYWPRVSAPG